MISQRVCGRLGQDPDGVGVSGREVGCEGVGEALPTTPYDAWQGSHTEKAIMEIGDLCLKKMYVDFSYKVIIGLDSLQMRRVERPNNNLF